MCGCGSHNTYLGFIVIHSESVNLISMAILMLAFRLMACCCPGALASIFNIYHKAGGRKRKAYNGDVGLPFFHPPGAAAAMNRGPWANTGMQPQQVPAEEQGGAGAVYPMVAMGASNPVPSYLGPRRIAY